MSGQMTSVGNRDKQRGALVLLARFDSSRLPGKQLKPLGNTTVLDLMVSRLKASHHNLPIILATSDREVDEPLADFARQAGLECYRGSALDVAGRCLACMQDLDLDWFVRLCGDSPFQDASHLDQVIDAYLKSDCDIACNIFPRTVPNGASVEVISRAAMQHICEATSDMAFLEHVTLYAYKNPESFHILNMEGDEDRYRDLSIAVDTARDLEMAEWIVTQLGDAQKAPLEEIAAYARQWQAENGAST